MTSLASAEKTILNRLLPELTQLSTAARIELIHQLVDSMRQEPAPRKSLLDFAGAWNSMPESAEELIAEIRNSRSFTRPEISLD